MDVLVFSLNAILPIIILSVVGFFLKKINFLSSEFLNTANALCFKVFLPALLFVNVYSIETIQSVQWDVIAFTAVITFGIFVLGFLYVILFVKRADQKGVMLQGFFRSNYVVIGVSLAFSIAGEESQKLAALLAAFMVPFYNILAVIALTVFIPQDKEKNASPLHNFFDIIKKVITNPLILGALAGLLCLVIRPFVGTWRLKSSEFAFVFQSIEQLAQLATPLALIVLGGEFTFSAVKNLLPKIFQAVLVRLVIAPIMGLGLLALIYPDFGAVEYAAFLGLFAAPTAVSSAIMAQSMKNDAELARQIVVWTSVFSAFTLFGFTAFFRAIGIF